MNDQYYDFAITGGVPRTDAQIERAKRMAVGGGRKRCRKGKSCSATCIAGNKICLVDLPWVANNAINKVRARLLKKAPLTKQEREKAISGDIGAMFLRQLKEGQQKPKSVPQDLKAQLAALGGPVVLEGRQLDRSPGARTKTPAQKEASSLFMSDISRIMRGETPQRLRVASAGDEGGIKARRKDTAPRTGPTATGNTKWAREDAKDFDGGLGKVRREGSKSFAGWNGSYGSGATKIGEGSYGTVIRNPDGTFVKRGAISDTEAKLIDKLGKLDLGPRLVAADINGAHPYNRENFVDIKNGRIAMSRVEGKPMGSRANPETQFGGKNAADVYWKAMADLHRQGIAHNDAHIDNILVDKSGKGRWVDLGLAQASPKAALAEALGVFQPLKGGDAVTVPSKATGNGNWQTLRWNGTGTTRLNNARNVGGATWAEAQKRFPVASRVWENKPDVLFKMKKMGLDVNEINSMIAHGIRSPLSSYDRSDGFGKITDKQAQDLLNTLYDGI